jgi:hypothetical protein
MFKKIVTISFLFLLSIKIIFLSGSDQKLNQFATVVEWEFDWGNLFVEGHEIDFKAAELAQRKLKGGCYDNYLHVVIPNDLMQTRTEWKKAKDHIAGMIGPISTLSSSERSLLWENNSKNVDDLLKDAKSLAPSFKEDFKCIALKTGANAFFGQNDQNILKTRESLISKVQRDAHVLELSEEEAVAKIGDVLRGTIIVDRLDQIPIVIDHIINYADYKDGQVMFKNIWTEDRQSGYVGIHAKLLLPLPLDEESKEQRHLLAEMQIHLHSMVDGTDDCVKEREHKIYEHVRGENVKQPKLSAASQLLYLTAMEDLLNKVNKK